MATTLIGRIFGRLEVIGTGRRKGRHRLWICRCRCGKEKEIRGDNLIAGVSTSCGCFHREVVSKHGAAGTEIYMIWGLMLARCRNPNALNYHLYGERGIRVCDRWHDFTNFAVDMGPRPSPLHTLDRIDNNGNYEASNCRWATKKEQARNKRNNVLLTYRGETFTMSEWAERLDCTKHIILKRLRRGWSVERTLETPSLRTGNRKI
jgi:hypothetical protein